MFSLTSGRAEETAGGSEVPTSAALKVGIKIWVTMSRMQELRNAQQRKARGGETVRSGTKVSQMPVSICKYSVDQKSSEEWTAQPCTASLCEGAAKGGPLSAPSFVTLAGPHKIFLKHALCSVQEPLQTCFLPCTLTLPSLLAAGFIIFIFFLGQRLALQFDHLVQTAFRFLYKKVCVGGQLNIFQTKIHLVKCISLIHRVNSTLGMQK